MLDHIGETVIASRVRAAFERTVRHSGALTRDLGGSASTSEFADAVVAEMAA
jgi:isocitrate dehydrogenase (NAD+)